MSVFDTQETNEGKPQDSQQNTDWLGQVVEAKGEKFKDPNELAKGYVHAQRHIDEMEAELAQLREAKKKGEWTDEVLDRLGQRQPTSRVDGQVNAGTSDKGTPPAPSEDDLKSLIKTTLTEQERERTAEQNRQKVEEGLRTLYGTEAKSRLEEKSKELGMSVKRLQALAEESPTAFFTLIGEPGQKETNRLASTKVNTSSGFDQSGRKNWAYYQKLRREQPKLYRSPAIQNEVISERQKQGEAFYS